MKILFKVMHIQDMLKSRQNIIMDTVKVLRGANIIALQQNAKGWLKAYLIIVLDCPEVTHLKVIDVPLINRWTVFTIDC